MQIKDLALAALTGLSFLIAPSTLLLAETTLADIVQGGNIQQKFPEAGNQAARQGEEAEISLPDPALAPGENDPVPLLSVDRPSPSDGVLIEEGGAASEV